MKKTFVTGPLAVLAAAGAALAQEATGKAPGRRRRHAADLGREPAGQELRHQDGAAPERDPAELTKRQTEIAKIDASIKTLQDELQKQSAILCAEAGEKKQQEIVSKGRDRQAFVEDSQAEIQRMQQRAQQKAQSINTSSSSRCGRSSSRGQGEGLRLHARRAGRLHDQQGVRHHPRRDREGGRHREGQARGRRGPGTRAGGPQARKLRRRRAGRWGSGPQSLLRARPGAGLLPHELRRDRTARPPASHPVPVRAGRPDHRVRSRWPAGGGQERDRRRGLLRRPLPGRTGDAGRPDPGVPGAGRGHLAAQAAPDPRPIEVRVVGIDNAKFRAR